MFIRSLMSIGSTAASICATAHEVSQSLTKVRCFIAEQQKKMNDCLNNDGDEKCLFISTELSINHSIIRFGSD
jgi:hypothetical protein